MDQQKNKEILVLDKVGFSFEKPILKNISFSVEKGEIVGIVGKSGIGKSTLLKLISGILDVKEGQIFFNNKIVRGPAYNLIPGHPDIKLVYQDFHLDVYHTVKENIRNEVLHLTKDKRDKKVEFLLKLLGLNHIQHLKALEISGGEQQRLAIARAIASQPKMILLDEPFVHLDFHLKAKVSTYLKRLNKKGVTILIVSHDGIDLLGLTSRIVHVEKGIVKRIDTPINFYYHPKTKNEALLFGDINQIEIENKKHLFRPNEFQLQGNENHRIAVNYVDSYFCGSYFVSNFVTNKNEKLKLFHSEILKDVKNIYLKKEN